MVTQAIDITLAEVEVIEENARAATETVDAPLPLATSMQLAADVLRLAAVVKRLYEIIERGDYGKESQSFF